MENQEKLRKLRKGMDEMNNLMKAIRFNHGKESESFKARVNPEKELQHYKEKIVQLGLPRRFGLSKRLAKTESNMGIELDDPMEVDSTQEPHHMNPDHKRRGIFD